MYLLSIRFSPFYVSRSMRLFSQQSTANVYEEQSIFLEVWGTGNVVGKIGNENYYFSLSNTINMDIIPVVRFLDKNFLTNLILTYLIH